MTNFFNRPVAEQELIANFYNFEVAMIAEIDLAKMSEPNPYWEQLVALPDGKAILEALNDALDMAAGI